MLTRNQIVVVVVVWRTTATAFVLTVDILEALHLKPMDRQTRTTHPYVIAVLGDKATRTPAIRREATRPVGTIV